jgi:hypothetical protein
MDGQRAYENSQSVGAALGVKLRAWSELTPDERIAWAEIAHESQSADRSLTFKQKGGTLLP